MHTIVKVALTAAAVVAVAWPLLFWAPAQTAPSHHGASYPTAEQREQPPIYSTLDRRPLSW